MTIKDRLNEVSARKRMRVTKSDKLKRERKAKKNERMGEKIWVEVTSQPKKTGKAWVGRASFYRKKDKEKKKHSVPITMGSKAKLKIKSKKLYVNPKDGDEYIYGGDKTTETKEESKRDEGGMENDLAPPAVDNTGDGVQDMARVGVPAHVVPTPPNIPRLPNLTEEEKAIEARAVEVFENDPDGVTDQYMKMVGDGNKFVTDDVKLLFPDYTPKGKSPEEVAATRARHNVLLHQVANAIAKRAFVKKLDELGALDDDDPRKSVLITSGGCGCHAKDTPILMYDGTMKMVQDVRLGDQLMGPDSTPRNVLERKRGTGQMHWINPRKGKSFKVNEDHVLSMVTKRAPGSMKRTKDVVVNMTIREIQERGKSFLENSRLYRTGVDFEAKEVPLDPYFLGLWLGDGTHCSASVTTMDPEIVTFMQEYTAQFSGTHLTVHEKPNNAASVYQIAKDQVGAGRYNPVMSLLKEVNVLSNKHIPMEYMVNSREVRSQILAGLMDSDGHLSKSCIFDFISKYDHISENVAYIARSLGLAAYVTMCEKTNSTTGISGTYYRVGISGDLSIIPTRVVRKQAGIRKQIKENGHRQRNVLVSGFSIEEAGVEDYFGFTIDNDSLYLMGDFTVTHNSGKGYAVKNGPDEVKDKVGSMGAVWDAAGEQNATENPWILDEARKRGIKTSFVFVDSDPAKTWAGPWGVVNRAANPPPKGEGRMVDARLFADSYAEGAKNMKQFMDNVGEVDDVDFMVLNSRGGDPKLETSISDAALGIKSDELYKESLKAIDEGAAPTEAIKHGATIGKRIWGAPGVESDPSVAASLLSAKAVLSDLQKEYRKYFTSKLEEYGVKSPADIPDDKKKEFFNAVDDGWDEGKGPKNGLSGFALLSAKKDSDDLSENLLRNLTANTGSDEAHEAFFSAKWEDDKKALDHQLVDDGNGGLKIPASDSEESDQDVEGDVGPDEEDSGEEETQDSMSASIQARIDNVAERMVDLRVSTMTRLFVEEAADLLIKDTESK